ncbi:MAG TPA: D-Ala-D-Ala carboxypeptidase family metallohydrolase [Gemmatimonadaceae bacterium]|nr:D-Ala-D-Ala carboxypeptidase family metallohydrolase [Gemmatimonadaceae bacterium]
MSTTLPPERRRRGRRRAGAARLVCLAAAFTATLGVAQLYKPARRLTGGTADAALAFPAAAPAPMGFGKSGEVSTRFALPGEVVEYPLEISGEAVGLAYQWVRAGETYMAHAPRPLLGPAVTAPEEPGFYQLAVVRAGRAEIVDGITLAVLVPFSAKVGTTLKGYKIGTYLAERLGGTAPSGAPVGFVEVDQADLERPLSKHFRLADFVTRDGQQTWPKYIAVNPRLLDKLELVVAEIRRWHGDGANVELALDVHSGFRTPSYNRGVKRAARDSRHQYGDAADVTIDADGDGRFTAADSRLVALAVEVVERNHPELAGGLGLYTNRSNRTPYVHIDARGSRVRWRG